MTVKDQLNILDRKIKQNKADYDFYRQNAEISALSSGDLNKYEYLTNKDLSYKPSPVEKAKFEYSLLGQVFNKGLTTDERQEGLLKRLKNIEDRTDNQLRAIRGQQKNQSSIKSIGFNFKEGLSPEGLRGYNAIVKKENSINYSYLYMKFGRQEYDFRMFKKLKPFFEEIYYGHRKIDVTERDQDVFQQGIERLEKYNSRVEPNISHKNETLKSSKNLSEGRKMIIDAFKNKLFPLSSGNYYDEHNVSESEESSKSGKPSGSKDSSQPTMKEK